MDAEDRPGDEVGGGLVGEGLADLVVADDPVEPLVGGLVGNDVAKVDRGRVARDPDQPGDSMPAPPADSTTSNVG